MIITSTSLLYMVDFSTKVPTWRLWVLLHPWGLDIQEVQTVYWDSKLDKGDILKKKKKPNQTKAEIKHKQTNTKTNENVCLFSPKDLQLRSLKTWEMKNIDIFESPCLPTSFTSISWLYCSFSPLVLKWTCVREYPSSL